MVHRPVKCAAALLIAACTPTPSFHQITVQGVDYAFVAPDTVPAGLTAFAFENAGAVDHEMGLSLLQPGVTMHDVIMEDSLGTPADSIWGPDAGLLFADPNERADGRLLVDLLPDRDYILWCYYRDGRDEPQHAELGMLRTITVR